MRNSWGQEIKVGDVVYRGARAGTTSEYRVGVVESLKPGKNPRIKYLFESSIKWIHVNGDYVSTPSIWKPSRSSSGSPTIESLVVVDFNLDELERRAEFFKKLDKDFNFNSWNEFYEALESYRAELA